MNVPKSLVLNYNYKQIATLFFPIALSFFIPQINLFTNSLFISKLGEVYFASYTIIAVYYLIFAVVGMSINSGLQMLMAKHAGANNHESFTNYFNNGNTFGLLFSFLGIAFTYLFLEPILNLCIHNKAIIDIAMPFIKIRILGLPFLYLYLSRNALFININKAHFLIYTSLLETGINIFFDYTFIFGYWHFPKLGIQGAAWSSIISEAAGYLASLFLIQFYVKKIIPLKYEFKTQKKILNDILYTSLPLIMQYLFAVVSWEIFFILIENLGARELAISGLMRTLISVLAIVPWALGQTTNTIMSNILGQKKQTVIPAILKKIIFISVSFTSIICFVSFCFYDAIVHQFTSDANFIATAKMSFVIILMAILIMGFGNILLNTTISLGDTKINLYIEIIAATCYLTYSIITIKYLHLSLTWAWMAEIVYWLITSLLAFFYFLKWKKNATLCL